MKCTKAQIMLSLYAGNDLPQKKIPELLDHLQNCGDCRAELQVLKKNMMLITDISGKDIPKPLPDDFAGIIHRAIAAQGSAGSNTESKFRLPWGWKPMMAALGTALSLLILIMIIGDNARVRPFLRPGQTALKWEKIKAGFSESLLGPIKLADWQAPSQAGVCAVMHRPDPENDPDLFVIDYLGESSVISSYKNYPWIEHRKKQLVKVTGNEDNIYIAVYLMPGSSKWDRKQLEKSLIKEYKPYFNKKTGV